MIPHQTERCSGTRSAVELRKVHENRRIKRTRIRTIRMSISMLIPSSMSMVPINVREAQLAEEQRDEFIAKKVQNT